MGLGRCSFVVGPVLAFMTLLHTSESIFFMTLSHRSGFGFFYDLAALREGVLSWFRGHKPPFFLQPPPLSWAHSTIIMVKQVVPSVGPSTITSPHFVSIIVTRSFTEAPTWWSNEHRVGMDRTRFGPSSWYRALDQALVLRV